MSLDHLFYPSLSCSIFTDIWDKRIFASIQDKDEQRLTLCIQCHAGILYLFTNNLKVIFFFF